jgi:hypothetical protein
MSLPGVILLFDRDKNKEPPGILQCDSSGEYFPYYFFDWRDSIHYLLWCNATNKKFDMVKNYNEWCTTYGYDENELFNGDLNEFRSSIDKSDEFIQIYTSIGDISLCDDLSAKSAWND